MMRRFLIVCLAASCCPAFASENAKNQDSWIRVFGDVTITSEPFMESLDFHGYFFACFAVSNTSANVEHRVSLASSRIRKNDTPLPPNSVSRIFIPMRASERVSSFSVLIDGKAVTDTRGRNLV